MKLISILISASTIISMVAASRLSLSQQLQQRALDNHLIHKRGSIHSSLDTRGAPRLLRKRSKHSKDCSDRKKKHKHHSKGSKDTGSTSSKSGSTNNDSSSSRKKSSGKTNSIKSSGKSYASSKDASEAESTPSSSGKSGLAGKTFSGQCKHPNASDQSPNGNINFLNCGISKSDKSSKWNPPNLQMKDITTISSEEAAKASVFKPCSKYHSEFEKAEKSTGIPVVMLMSFAMQESTCNPHETGGNGEVRSVFS
jgi:hypothetical protein